MASTGESDFPKFEDGNVTIVVSTSRVFKLHSHVLSRGSAYFKTILETTEAPRLLAAARREGYTPWRFQLVDTPNPLTPNEQHGSFLPVRIGESGQVQGNRIPPLRGPNMIAGEDDGDKCWDWLFGCFYGIAPGFDSSTFGTLLKDCFVLTDVAESIGAVDQVREPVDLALMRQDEVLWKSIAGNPVVWAQLGRRVRSPAIFKEAIIHIVGKWKMLTAESKDQLPDDVRVLCCMKFEELELAKRAIEIRMAGHYPNHLCRNSGDKPHRTAYAVDIYSWMALCYFRQYLSQSGNDGRNRQADDGGYAWYKALAAGGDAYLDHEAMREFHSLFPMSPKACGVLEAHLNVLKDQIKIFIKDLMVNRSHVDPETLGEKPWLTCIVVEEEDLPWTTAQESET